MIIKRKFFISIPLSFLIFFSFLFIPKVNATNNAASLFFDTPLLKVNRGDDIRISIKVQSSDQSINAVSGSFKIPNNFQLKSIDTTGSILDFWISDPQAQNGTASFQGVAIKKSYQGNSGLLFTMEGVVTASGKFSLNFTNGAVLADDGEGTNVLGSLKTLTITVQDGTQGVAVNNVTQNIITKPPNPVSVTPESSPIIAAIIPPVITSSSPPVDQSQNISIVGKGTPNALTKIQFQNVSDPSFGRRFIQYLIKDRVPLSDVEVQNDSAGVFSYTSPSNLVAGAYDAVPSYISFDKLTSVIGYGVKVFVTDNTLSKILIIIINALVLIIPIVALILVIIFLPWYFKRRLRLINKRMEFEEQKIDAEEHNLGQNPGKSKRI